MNHTYQKTGSAHRRWRTIKDQAARYGIGIGGVGVIAAIVLILAYLVWVVIPLFLPASVQPPARYAIPDATGPTRFLAVEEQSEVGLRIGAAGRAVFFTVADGTVRREAVLPVPEGVTVDSVSPGDRSSGLLALGLSNGRVLVLRHHYPLTFEGDRRTVETRLEFPYGEQPLTVVENGATLADVAYADSGDRATIAAVDATGNVHLMRLDKQESFLTGEVTLTPRRIDLDTGGFSARLVEISDDQRWLFVLGHDDSLSFFDIRGSKAQLIEHNSAIVPDGEPITAMEMLTGGISLMLGTGGGRVLQLFPVRDAANRYRLEHIRSFETQDSAITAIATEQRRKGFVTGNAAGGIGIYYATGGTTVTTLNMGDEPIERLAVSPRSDALLVQTAGGTLAFRELENEHPEVSWSALWQRIWYENYGEPRFIWQSSAATSDFEPKFSLVPLSFGTLKAAFYAMLFAVPLALMGAIYTANFMAPRLRRVVKPTVEIMEALPTVILGFLAGLWLAPLVEDHLASIFAGLVLLPFAVVVCSWLWTRFVPSRVRDRVPEGWDPALLVPVLLLAAWVAGALGDAVEAALFGGNVRMWLSTELGIGYDQRNALVVGIAMGVAVVPTIFSIAEDAIYGVPKSLSEGSLALGATPWDTLMRVVLPTASPGIFSALMIGLGRAVGETMIVLMATGNTPVMDFSIFEGMRTLSANIAVEMPESELNSTHYRVLFLAALVLFAFTFMVNTGAEVIRQRLRKKYSSL